MGKDPAFLFYSQDWIVGCQTLTMEERGQYITILAQMHQQGRLSEETISFLVGSVSVKLKSKFGIDENGLWFSPRLETEVEKRTRFIESRKLNGKRGGRPKKKNLPKTYQKPNAKAKKNLPEDENEIENKNVNKNATILIHPFNSDRWVQTWAMWVNYRNKIKKPYKTFESEQAQLKWFADNNFSEKDSIAMIEKSIRNTWQGIFELDHKNNGKQTGGFSDEEIITAAYRGRK